MKRENPFLHFATHWNAVAFEQSGLSVVNHLTPSPRIDVFGLKPFHIVCRKALFDPCLTRAFEPRLQSTGRPNLPPVWSAVQTKSMMEREIVNRVRGQRPWVDRQRDRFFGSVPEVRPGRSQNTG